MYGIGGERRLTEFELDELPGYEGSKPGAGRQRRRPSSSSSTSTASSRSSCLAHERSSRHRATRAVDALAGRRRATCETIWREPDEGIWEVRGPRRHFTHSKVMAWVVFDRVDQAGRAASSSRRRSSAGSRSATRSTPRSASRATTRSAARSRSTTDPRSSTRACSSIPLVGFLPARRRARDRARSTRSSASSRGTASSRATRPSRHRRRPAGRRGAVPRLLVLARRRARAAPGGWTRRARCSSGCSASRNDLGLLAEEYDVERRRQVGNFPQAFSHLALINAARVIAARRAGARTGAAACLSRRTRSWRASSAAGPSDDARDLRRHRRPRACASCCRRSTTSRTRGRCRSAST